MNRGPRHPGPGRPPPRRCLPGVLCATVVGCAAPAANKDTGVQVGPPPSPCTLDYPLETDNRMPFWAATVDELLALLPQEPVSGTLHRPDEQSGPMRLQVEWAPGPRDTVLWADTWAAEGACPSRFLTDFAVPELTIDGVQIAQIEVYAAALHSSGLVELTLEGRAGRVSGTLLEPPAGAQQLDLRVELLALLPPAGAGSPDEGAPAEEHGWTAEVWIDQDTGWATGQTRFLLARGTLPWTATD